MQSKHKSNYWTPLAEKKNHPKGTNFSKCAVANVNICFPGFFCVFLFAIVRHVASGQTIQWKTVLEQQIFLFVCLSHPNPCCQVVQRQF